MQIKHKVYGALATVAVSGIAVAATLSATGAGADSAPSVRVSQAPSETLPQLVQRALDRPGSATAEFAIDAASARRAELPSGKTVWVTPGSKGTCVWDTDASGSCATDEEIAAGKLALVSTPPFDGPPARDKPVRFKAGPLTVVGYAPNFSEATVIDGSGEVRGRQQTSSGFYEIVVDAQANWKPGAGWKLQLTPSADNPAQQLTRLPL